MGTYVKNFTYVCRSVNKIHLFIIIRIGRAFCWRRTSACKRSSRRGGSSSCAWHACVACVSGRGAPRCTLLRPCEPHLPQRARVSARRGPVAQRCTASARGGLPRTRCATFNTPPPRRWLARPPCPTTPTAARTANSATSLRRR
jgi:hypothetical protein